MSMVPGGGLSSSGVRGHGMPMRLFHARLAAM